MLDRTRWGNDAPWWYNERASLSHLAGALWQSNGWVTFRAAHTLEATAAIAWAFQAATRALRSLRSPHHYFPGVVLVIARCPRPETERSWRNKGVGDAGP